MPADAPRRAVHPRAARPPVSAGVAALALVLTAAAALAAAVARQQSLGAVRATERAAAAWHAPEPVHEASPAVLDAGNALVFEPRRRDLRLSARLLLRPRSVLDVRVRAPRVDRAEGLVLRLSSDDGLPGGWFREGPGEFAALAPAAATLAPDRPVQLELRAEGRTLVATIDGRPFARHEGDVRAPAGGGVAILAQTGEARIEDLSIDAPASTPPRPPRVEPLALRAGYSVGAMPLLWAALAAALLGTRFLRALLPASLAAVPLVVLVVSFAPEARPTPLGFGAACAASTLVLVVAAVRFAGRGRAARGLLLLLVGAALPAAALDLAAGRRPAFDEARLNGMSYVDWEGATRVGGDDRLWLAHPLLRRFNGYLAAHAFRERRFTMEKPPGVQRVICLGSSGTWGYGLPEGSGLDYPTQLEALLNAGAAGAARDGAGAAAGAAGDDAGATAGGVGRRVEVLNAAWQAAPGGRLFRFLRDVGTRFDPDVVTLSVYFADAFALSQGDEEGYLALLAGEDGPPSMLDELRHRRALRRDRKLISQLQEFMAHSTSGRPPPAGLLARLAGEASPVERFEALLRRFVALCRERGVRLVLIQEPVDRPETFLLREEFAEAVRRVGAEADLPVLDPRPAMLRSLGGAERATDPRNARAPNAAFLDPVHPTPAGHRAIAEHIAPFVVAELRRTAGGSHR